MKFRLFQALTSHGILSFVFIGQGADGVKGLEYVPLEHGTEKRWLSFCLELSISRQPL